VRLGRTDDHVLSPAPTLAPAPAAGHDRPDRPDWPGDQFRHRRGLERSREEETLCERTAQVAQTLSLGRCLDALGDGRHPECPRDLDDGAHHTGASGRIVKRCD
jgi:hypothetical protein